MSSAPTPSESTTLSEAHTGHKTQLSIDRSRYFVGTGVACDIVLADPCAARVHCVLERRGHAWFVRDLGSVNGTFVNGQRVECAELVTGRTLTVGLTTWTVQAAQH